MANLRWKELLYISIRLILKLFNLIVYNPKIYEIVIIRINFGFMGLISIAECPMTHFSIIVVIIYH